MRHFILTLIASIIIAGEAPPPPAIQKMLDASLEATAKVHDTYTQAVRKEQDKLVASLLKEQDKATKKGDLDGALAIKVWVEKIQGGHLQAQATATADLMGDGSAVTPGVPTAASLVTDCPIAADNTPPHNVPKEFETVADKAVRIVIPKKDTARYTFTCTAAGLVAVTSGGSERNNVELWVELEKSGFKRLGDTQGVFWLVLEAKPGTKFVAFDPPLAGASVSIYAGKLTRTK